MAQKIKIKIKIEASTYLCTDLTTLILAALLELRTPD